MNKYTCFLIFLLVTGSTLYGQNDTLPNFSATNVGNNRIIVGWNNRFESIRQISIQRSFDSISGFKTILTVPDPTTPQNGFADTKAPNDHMFYRIYIMLDKGVFLFSPSKRPGINIGSTASVSGIPISVDTAVSYKQPPPRPVGWVASKYVFTNRDGYIRILLADVVDNKYTIKFYTDDDDMLFELKDIKEHDFKIDKSNFYKAGWFKFELYKDGDLVEKNKFYLQKEF